MKSNRLWRSLWLGRMEDDRTVFRVIVASWKYSITPTPIVNFDERLIGVEEETERSSVTCPKCANTQYQSNFDWRCIPGPIRWRSGTLKLLPNLNGLYNEYIWKLFFFFSIYAHLRLLSCHLLKNLQQNIVTAAAKNFIVIKYQRVKDNVIKSDLNTFGF